MTWIKNFAEDEVEGLVKVIRSRMTVSSCVTNLGAKILGAIAVLLLAAFPAVAGEAKTPAAAFETDCRYLTSEDLRAARDSGPLGKLWFPHGDIFRPLIADMKQPRFYMSFRSVDFRGTALPTGGQDDSITAAVVALGKDLGIWRRSKRNRCNGLQVNLSFRRQALRISSRCWSGSNSEAADRSPQ